MVASILVLLVFGMALMVLETFVPGGIVGALGALSVLAAVVLVLVAPEFDHWPSWLRTVTATGMVLGSGVLMLVWMRCFAVRFFSRAFNLETSLPSPENPAGIDAGAKGIALTDLRPLGRADFQGRRREVRCQSGFAAAGTAVQVTGAEPGNLVVRVIESLQP